MYGSHEFKRAVIDKGFKKKKFQREDDWKRYFQFTILTILLMKHWICNESKTDFFTNLVRVCVCVKRGG